MKEDCDMNTFDFQDGNGSVPAHKHSNGGGWVADTAEVEKSAYVGPKAWVYGNAKVFGKATINGTSWVYGNAKIYDTAKVYGDAVVCGNARVYNNTKVFNSVVFGDPRNLDEIDMINKEIV